VLSQAPTGGSFIDLRALLKDFLTSSYRTSIWKGRVEYWLGTEYLPGQRETSENSSDWPSAALVDLMTRSVQLELILFGRSHVF
jgi:hypothetical protein